MRVAALNLYVRIYPSVRVGPSISRSVCLQGHYTNTIYEIRNTSATGVGEPMSLPRSQSQSQSIDEFRVGDLWGRATGQPFSAVAITWTLSPVPVVYIPYHIYPM